MMRPHSFFSPLVGWRTLRWVLAAPALPFALWACNTQPLQKPEPVPEQENDQYVDVNPVRDLDLLFMIDNSPSMSDKQDNLRKNMPVLVNKLKEIQGGLPNVHIGVVTSDLGAGSTVLAGGQCSPGGQRGILRSTDGVTQQPCGLDPNSNFISSLNGGTMNNFQGDISTVFSCIAHVGDRGCGFEHQLQATRVALYESVTPENKGFLRKDAFLGIILLSDEDDCSADTKTTLFTDDAKFPGTTESFRCAQVGHLCNGQKPPVGNFMAPLATCSTNDDGTLIKVDDIVASIRALKERPDQQIIVAAITGWADDPMTAQYAYGPSTDPAEHGLIDYLPICAGNGLGSATAAIRTKKFIDSFANGTLQSICAADFSPAMNAIGEKLKAAIGNSCITAPVVDTRADQPGVQPDCQVTDRIPAGNGFTDDPLPPCSTGNKSQDGACWQLAADTNCGASGFKIDVMRSQMATPGTQQSIKCLTCARPGDPRCMH